MPATLQRKLVLDDKPSVVLATVETARQLLVGHDEDDILSLIEEGFLAYAWNIALSTHAARDPRIFPDCIAWYARTMGKGTYTRTDDQVLAELLKTNGDKPFIKGTTVRLILNCSSTHLINLVEAKQLALQPGTSYQRGPTGTPLVTVASFRQFLRSRRLP